MDDEALDSKQGVVSKFGRKTTKGKLIAVVGPTASGKSDLAMHIAGMIGGEIIAADSRTAYKGMDIVTAKPNEEEMLLIPHHLVSIVGPNQKLSVAEFQILALSAMQGIWQRGHVPLLVGGSGLYIDSILFDYQFPEESNEGLREELNGLGDEDLIKRLEKVDPEIAQTIDKGNRRRVIRAIETAGQPKSKSAILRANTLVLGLAWDKEVIQKRIVERIEKMLEKGLIDEIREVGEVYGWDSEALTGIGYRAFRDHISGNKTLEEAKADFARGDMQLVKKQITWFKRNTEINWLDGDDRELAKKADRLVSLFLSA